jgi:hypothetical protein
MNHRKTDLGIPSRLLFAQICQSSASLIASPRCAAIRGAAAKAVTSFNIQKKLGPFRDLLATM